MSFWKPRPVRHRPNCVLTVMPWWHYARQKETRCHSREVFQVWNRWRPRMSCTCRHIKKNLQKTAVSNLGMRTYPHCSHFYIQNLSLNFTSKKHWFHVDISLALSGLAADWQEPTKECGGCGVLLPVVEVGLLISLPCLHWGFLPQHRRQAFCHSGPAAWLGAEVARLSGESSERGVSPGRQPSTGYAESSSATNFHVAGWSRLLWECSHFLFTAHFDASVSECLWANENWMKTADFLFSDKWQIKRFLGAEQRSLRLSLTNWFHWTQGSEQSKNVHVKMNNTH